MHAEVLDGDESGVYYQRECDRCGDIARPFDEWDSEIIANAEQVEILRREWNQACDARRALDSEIAAARRVRAERERRATPAENVRAWIAVAEKVLATHNYSAGTSLVWSSDVESLSLIFGLGLKFDSLDALFTDPDPIPLAQEFRAALRSSAIDNRAARLAAVSCFWFLSRHRRTESMVGMSAESFDEGEFIETTHDVPIESPEWEGNRSLFKALAAQFARSAEVTALATREEVAFELEICRATEDALRARQLFGITVQRGYRLEAEIAPNRAMFEYLHAFGSHIDAHLGFSSPHVGSCVERVHRWLGVFDLWPVQPFRLSALSDLGFSPLQDSWDDNPIESCVITVWACLLDQKPTVDVTGLKWVCSHLRIAAAAGIPRWSDIAQCAILARANYECENWGPAAECYARLSEMLEGSPAKVFAALAAAEIYSERLRDYETAERCLVALAESATHTRERVYARLISTQLAAGKVREARATYLRAADAGFEDLVVTDKRILLSSADEDLASIERDLQQWPVYRRLSSHAQDAWIWAEFNRRNAEAESRAAAYFWRTAAFSFSKGIEAEIRTVVFHPFKNSIRAAVDFDPDQLQGQDEKLFDFVYGHGVLTLGLMLNSLERCTLVRHFVQPCYPRLILQPSLDALKRLKDIRNSEGHNRLAPDKAIQSEPLARIVLAALYERENG